MKGISSTVTEAGEEGRAQAGIKEEISQQEEKSSPL